MREWGICFEIDYKWKVCVDKMYKNNLIFGSFFWIYFSLVWIVDRKSMWIFFNIVVINVIEVIKGKFKFEYFLNMFESDFNLWF